VMLYKRYVVSKEAAVQDSQGGLLGEIESQTGLASGYFRERIWPQEAPQLCSEHAWLADKSDWATAVAADCGIQPAVLGQPEAKANAEAINGSYATMPVKLGFMGAFRSFMITGGPYEDFPGRNKAYGVYLSAEPTPPAESFDVHLPIIDYRVPINLEATRQALVLTLKAALEGKAVYVGCCDGGNRMEFFLALLGKVTGRSGWVSHLRMYDSEQPMATDEQRRYVREFDAQELTAWLYRQAWYTVWDKVVGARRI
jgi:hypothetical protein